jgi:hypothetical protein
MQCCITEKVLTCAFVETYFDDLAGGISIREGEIPEPVVRVHAITAAGTASAIAFATSWFSAFGGTAITTSHRSANFWITNPNGGRQLMLEWNFYVLQDADHIYRIIASTLGNLLEKQHYM